MENWDLIFKKQGTKKPASDDWLDKFSQQLSSSGSVPVIDLGCGFGNDTLYLRERGYNVVSCDFSVEALNRLCHFIDNPAIMHFDMREGFPLADNTAQVVISDLSLHYFSSRQTAEIISEISRVLNDGGYLLGRVNSVKDVNHGAGKGAMIENNFYNIDGNLKRFFDREHLESFFGSWEMEYMEEKEMRRYKELKIVWEFSAINRKNTG